MKGQALHFIWGGFTPLNFHTQYLLFLLLKGFWRKCVSVCEECKKLGREVPEYEWVRKWTVWRAAI
jgi:hypothetical protein